MTSIHYMETGAGALAVAARPDPASEDRQRGAHARASPGDAYTYTLSSTLKVQCTTYFEIRKLSIQYFRVLYNVHRS